MPNSLAAKFYFFVCHFPQIQNRGDVDINRTASITAVNNFETQFHNSGGYLLIKCTVVAAFRLFDSIDAAAAATAADSVVDSVDFVVARFRDERKFRKANDFPPVRRSV